MHAPTVASRPRLRASLLPWPRVRFTLLFSLALGLLVGLAVPSQYLVVVIRSVLLGLVLMLVFGAFEHRPRKRPRWLERWMLQVLAVAVAVPFASALVFALTNPPGAPAYYHVPETMRAYSMLTVLALLLAPWVALGSLVRQRDALARHQALAFDLERSELQRQALEARLRLLQAQVAPHFLFNTLANVQALVGRASPEAASAMRSLIAYLRAAVPRLGESVTTLGQEVELVEAYLELMQLRMPDRLQFSLEVDPAAREVRCPPMTLLTLVENAVRHGIDPSLEGGRIDVRVRLNEGRCHLLVEDSGVGLQNSEGGLGTGLSSLHERLRLVFDDSAELVVAAREPRGVRAEARFPAERVRR